jgi:HJR/Mrr/RecB family endonuclease
MSAPNIALHGLRELREELMKTQREVASDATTHISDAEFAQILAEYFRQVGYSVRTSHAGRDYRGRDCRGANLRLLKNGRSIAVRTEKHTELLGVEVAQHLIAATAFYDADDTWVLTTSSFTHEARELADRRGVRLIDGAEIGTWFTKLTDEEEPALLSRSAGRNVEMENHKRGPQARLLAPAPR